MRATARVEQAPEDVPDIHPNIAEIYKAKVVQLGEALADPELRDQTAEAIPRNQGCDGSFNDECAATLKEDGDMAVAGHGKRPGVARASPPSGR